MSMPSVGSGASPFRGFHDEMAAKIFSVHLMAVCSSIASGAAAAAAAGGSALAFGIF